MVKRSFFARLFGHHDASHGSRSDDAARVARSSGSAIQSKAKVRTLERPRVTDADFDEPAHGNGNGRSSARDAAAKPRATQAAPATTASSGKAPAPADAPVALDLPDAPDAIDAIESSAPVGVGLATNGTLGPVAVKATEMSRGEELALKLQDGFTGISSVLRGIDTKIDQQQKTSEELIVSVQRIPEMMKDVPDASRAGIELLNTISRILEFQGRTTNELLGKMRDLPGSLEGMEQRVQEQVASLARASQDAGRSARETRHELTAAFDGVKRVVEDVHVTATRRQDSLVDELRRHQSAQDARVEELLKRIGGSTRLVIFLMVVAIAALLVAVYGMNR